MRSGIFIWTVANDYGARIPDDDTLGAMNPALFKVNDGLNEMVPVPDAIVLAKQYRAQNIDMYTWGVGIGSSLEEAHAEGALAGQYAVATGSPYLLDLEPDPKGGYWHGISGAPQAFIAGFEEHADKRLIRLCPDARNPGINLEEWVMLLPEALWHPQAYYTAFHMTMHEGIVAAIRPLLNAGVPVGQIYPVLPLYVDTTGEPSINPSEVSQAIDLVAGWGYPGVAFWRRGLLSPEQVSMLLAKADPFITVPTPAPDSPLVALLKQALAIAEAGK